MSGFTVTALPAEQLDAIRARGVDDLGNQLVVFVNQNTGDTPLRCCLQEAQPGDQVVLMAWSPVPVPGAYAETGPVFVHATGCSGWSGPDYPEAFRHRRQIFRAYDHIGRQVENRLVEGSDAESALDDLLARPDVAYVHSRNPLAGCYMFSVAAC